MASLEGTPIIDDTREGDDDTLGADQAPDEGDVDQDDGDLTPGTGDLSAADRRAHLRNRVKKLREDRLLSKAELARKAGLSALTVDRIERGKPCRMDTKRKIILALGMRIEDKDQVFQADDDEA